MTTIVLNPINVLDAAAATKPIAAYTDGTNDVFAHVLWNSSGVLINPATSDNQATANTTLAAIQAAVTAALPAGSAIIGKVTTDQTAHGVTDLVAADITKVAGAAIALGHGTAAAAIRVELPTDGSGVVGLAAGTAKVGVFTTDQTTHGTTDLVAADITKVAGAAIAQGHGTAAQAIRVELPTDGTGVVGLAAGTAKIGVVTTDQTTHGTTDLVAADITKVAGLAVATGHGTAAGAIRVELPTDGTGVVGLAAGSAKVGVFTTDQTTHGTTDLVAADITKIGGTAVSLGQKANANAIPVVQAGPRIVAGGSFTRPANTTAYVTGQLVASSTSSTTVNANIPSCSLAPANDVPVAVKSARLYASSTSTTNAAFRIHLFSAAPTVTNGDGGTFLATMANAAGFIDVTLTYGGSDNAFGKGYPTFTDAINVAPAAGTQTVYWLIEARSGYTPTSGETFTVMFEVA